METRLSCNTLVDHARTKKRATHFDLAPRGAGDMAQSAWSVGEKPLDTLENVEEDPSWMKLLPYGAIVTSTEPSGAASFWSRTARINVRLSSGEDVSYFFKLMDGARGRLMAEGEYESMLALHSVAEDMVPNPLGWGTLEANPDGHFFLCEYVDLADEIPDPSSVCKKLADLHRRSMAVSCGKFGFKVTTCNGTFPQINRWNESWEAFFSQQMEGAFSAEQEIQGVCEDYQRLLPAFFGKVIPRLLRPLETGGNTLKPALVHGDLWDGNVSFHAETDEPYIYDASAFWGHNEYDLHNWRAARFKLRKSFIKEYFKNFPMSPPQEDWDDRNLLYSIRADLHDSYLFPSTKRFRALVIAALEELVQKFPKGYEGPHECKGQGSEDAGEGANDCDAALLQVPPTTTVASTTAAIDPQDDVPGFVSDDAYRPTDGIAAAQMENIADAIGMVISNPGTTGSEIYVNLSSDGLHLRLHRDFGSSSTSSEQLSSRVLDFCSARLETPREGCVGIYFAAPTSNPDGWRFMQDGGVTDEYPVPLQCCSQAVTRGSAVGMRKPAQEISQVPLPCRAICDIRIMRDRLLGASSHDYMWPGELAVGSRERPDVAGIVWKAVFRSFKRLMMWTVMKVTEANNGNSQENPMVIDGDHNNNNLTD
ncbi:hypothetical protein GJ744_003894 [Endocarpon pusillum]|uniref:protein-ribulosamine 3-kinase n=1 Tax=Endocarpon pusillum TaxID=364733 RepID=A0A8H7E1V9_9EURO|nr:hypothetical protein GJ744_003894 [Endocarpon pusillum]